MSAHAYIVGGGNTAFGKLEGQGALDLMARAAQRATRATGFGAVSAPA